MRLNDNKRYAVRTYEYTKREKPMPSLRMLVNVDGLIARGLLLHRYKLLRRTVRLIFPKTKLSYYNSNDTTIIVQIHFNDDRM